MNKVATSSREELLSHESLSSYLRAEIFRRKKRGRGFNLSTLARRSKISPSLLSQILVGKRKLNSKTAEALADALSLRGRERRIFVLLARKDAAKTSSEKWEIENEIILLKGKISESALSLRQYRLVSEWYYTVLYVMIGQGFVSADLSGLIERFQGQVNSMQIRQAIQDLVDLELIELDSGKYRQKLGPVATGHNQNQAAIFRYHRQMLELANKALDRPSSEREFSGLTVAIPEEKLKVVKEKIRDFVSGLNEFLSEEGASNSPIYQLNLQLFKLVEGELTKNGDVS